jgi:hypothetical protein
LTPNDYYLAFRIAKIDLLTTSARILIQLSRLSNQRPSLKPAGQLLGRLVPRLCENSNYQITNAMLVKCEVDSLENVVRLKCEAHVFINFGPNNSLEILFTQPVPSPDLRVCMVKGLVNAQSEISGSEQD